MILTVNTPQVITSSTGGMELKILTVNTNDTNTPQVTTSSSGGMELKILTVNTNDTNTPQVTTSTTGGMELKTGSTQVWGFHLTVATISLLVSSTPSRYVRFLQFAYNPLD